MGAGSLIVLMIAAIAFGIAILISKIVLKVNDQQAER